MNNFRDWEALMAGAAPLVDNFAYNKDLWRGLPAVRVKKWYKLTPSYLRELASRMKIGASGFHFDISKCFLPHWLARIFGGARL